MIVPELKPTHRDREYKQRNFREISRIINGWLFQGKTHRNLDRDVLNLPAASKGYQSMGVLHHLGLRGESRGIYSKSHLGEVVQALSSSNQDFELIIGFLEDNPDGFEDSICTSLKKHYDSRNPDFSVDLENRLKNLQETDQQNTRATTRKEQSILRAFLFEKLSESKCSICHKTLPVDLLVAAHIKPRRDCSIEERKNFNVVMPACKIGCDDFFEKGYIFIDDSGLVQINKKNNTTEELNEILKKLSGKPCPHFGDKTKEFFSYRRRFSSRI